MAYLNFICVRLKYDIFNKYIYWLCRIIKENDP